jgi:NDP-sugar pyrophosphorylase family protein
MEHPSELTADTIEQVYRDAINDPSLLSGLDVDELLDTLENETNDYLENKTLDGITDEIYEGVCEICDEKEIQEKICLKLIGYRMIDELHELHKGKHVRWIRRGTNKLTNGGIVVDIKFLDTGTHVLCMNSMNRFIQYKYDECVTFQKMSSTEMLILMAYEHTNTLI